MSEQFESSIAKTAATFALCGTLTTALSYFLLSMWTYGSGDAGLIAVISGVGAGAGVAMQQHSTSDDASGAEGA
jgi:hypothetical protein